MTNHQPQQRRTQLRPTIEEALGRLADTSLDAIVTNGRGQKPPVSWGELAAEVYSQGGIYVSNVTLSKWYSHLPETA